MALQRRVLTGGSQCTGVKQRSRRNQFKQLSVYAQNSEQTEQDGEGPRPRQLQGYNWRNKKRNFFDYMNFGGIAPEIVNVRLGTIGFVSGVAAELRTHEPISGQVKNSPILVASVAAVFTFASFAPEFFGEGMEPYKAEESSPPGFTPKAELANCRLATWAFFAIIIIEQGLGVNLF